MLLAATLTAYLGESDAMEILDAHENVSNGRAHGPLPADRLMDLINNEVGIGIGNDIASAYSFDDVRTDLAVWLELDPFRAQAIRRAVGEAVLGGQGVFLEPAAFVRRQRAQST